MKVILTFLAVVISLNLSAQINDTAILERLVINNLKSYNIARTNKDTLAIKHILLDIDDNQKIFDSLVYAQIQFYFRLTNAYKDNLDSVSNKIIYNNNRLNQQLYDKLYLEKIDTLIQNNSIKLKIDKKYLKLNDESPYINFEINNHSTFTIKINATLINSKNNKIVNNMTTTVLPNTFNNMVEYLPYNYYANSSLKIEFTYLDADFKLQNFTETINFLDNKQHNIFVLNIKQISIYLKK